MWGATSSTTAAEAKVHEDVSDRREQQRSSFVIDSLRMEGGQRLPVVSQPSWMPSSATVPAQLATSGPLDLPDPWPGAHASPSRSIHSADADESCTTSPEPSSLALMLVARYSHRELQLQQCFSHWRDRHESRAQRRKWQERLAVEFHGRLVRYIFFRGWQWSFEQRKARRDRAQVAAGQRAVSLQMSVLRVWRTYTQWRKAQRDECAAITDKANMELSRRYLARWKHVVQIRARTEVLAERVQQESRRWYLRAWASTALQLKQDRLMQAVRAYLSNRESLACLIAAPTPYDPSCVDLARQYYWLLWLRYTNAQRGRRLGRHATALRQLELSVESVRRIRCWQRWTSCTLSTHQNKAQCEALMSRYYSRWKSMAMASVESHMVRSRANARDMILILRHWNTRASSRASHRQRWQVALEFEEQKSYQRRGRCALRLWRAAFHRSRQADQCRAAVAPARAALLQHIALRRLVDGVLATSPSTNSRDGFRGSTMSAERNRSTTAARVEWKMDRCPSLTPPIPLSRDPPHLTRMKSEIQQHSSRPPSSCGGEALATRSICTQTSPVMVRSPPAAEAPMRSDVAPSPPAMVYVPIYTPSVAPSVVPPASVSVSAVSHPAHPLPTMASAPSQGLEAPSYPSVFYGFDIPRHADPLHLVAERSPETASLVAPPAIGSTPAAVPPLPLAPRSVVVPQTVSEVGIDAQSRSAPLQHAMESWRRLKTERVRSTAPHSASVRPPTPTMSSRGRHTPRPTSGSAPALWLQTSTQEEISRRGPALLREYRELRKLAAAEEDEMQAIEDELGLVEMVLATSFVESTEEETNRLVRVQELQKRYAVLLQQCMRRRQKEAEVRQLTCVLQERFGVTMRGSGLSCASSEYSFTT